jgi:hypothetical protein
MRPTFPFAVLRKRASGAYTKSKNKRVPQRVPADSRAAPFPPLFHFGRKLLETSLRKARTLQDHYYLMHQDVSDADIYLKDSSEQDEFTG